MDIQRISSATAAFVPTPREQPLVHEVQPTQSPAVIQAVSRSLSDVSATKAQSDKERSVTDGFKEKSEGSFADKDSDEQPEQNKSASGNTTGSRLNKKV